LGTILDVLTIAVDAPRWFEWGGQAVFIIAGTAIPIAIGIAILRHGLYDIDLLINRTLVYGSLTATLVVLYFGGIVLLQRVFVVLTGEKSTLAVVGSTLISRRCSTL